MTEPLYITIKEACFRYSVGRTTIYELFQLDGCPPVMKLGNKTLLDVRAFDEFFRAQLQPAVPEQNKQRRRC